MLATNYCKVHLLALLVCQ